MLRTATPNKGRHRLLVSVQVYLFCPYRLVVATIVQLHHNWHVPSIFWLTLAFEYAVTNHYFITIDIVHYVDPNQECTVYYYAPTASQLGNFPPIWTPATLLANDTAGQAKWNSIKSSIPTNIPVKGTLAGDFSNFTPTYNPSDPDCWWTYDKCVTPKLSGLEPDVSNTPEPLSLGYGFDDGPNCSHNAFYDYLTQQNQKASGFLFTLRQMLSLCFYQLCSISVLMSWIGLWRLRVAWPMVTKFAFTLGPTGT